MIRLLKEGEIVKSNDLIWSKTTKRLHEVIEDDDTPIGRAYVRTWAPIFRDETPEWQTGRIPNPDGPSILILESVSGFECVGSVDKNSKRWDVAIYNGCDYSVNNLPKSYYTGRWFIVKLTEPKGGWVL